MLTFFRLNNGSLFYTLTRNDWQRHSRIARNERGGENCQSLRVRRPSGLERHKDRGDASRSNQSPYGATKEQGEGKRDVSRGEGRGDNASSTNPREPPKGVKRGRKPKAREGLKRGVKRAAPAPQAPHRKKNHDGTTKQPKVGRRWGGGATDRAGKFNIMPISWGGNEQTPHHHRPS